MEKNSGLAVDYEPMNVSAVANTPTSGVKRPADNHPDPSSEKRSVSLHTKAYPLPCSCQILCR